MSNAKSKHQPRGNSLGDDLAWRSRQEQNVTAIVEFSSHELGFIERRYVVGSRQGA